MKSFASLVLLILGALPGASMGYQQGLDPVFGTGGVATIPLTVNALSSESPPADTAALLIRIDDGRLYHVGASASGIAIARQFPRGGPDLTWGRTGVVRLRSDTHRLTAVAATIERGGSLLVAGHALSIEDGTMRPLLCRFLPYGTPDPMMHGTSDDVQGCTTDLPTGIDTADSSRSLALGVAVQSDGRILVATQTDQADGATLHLGRVFRDGRHDSGFGPSSDPLLNHGFVALSSNTKVRFSDPFAIAALRVDAADRIVLGGSVSRFDDAGNENKDLFVAAFLSDGMSDTNFGSADHTGFLTLDIPSSSTAKSDDQATDLVLRGNGEILLSGIAFTDKTDIHAVVVRLQANGEPEASFGDNGIALQPSCGPASWSHLAAIAVDSQERIILSGPVLTDVERLDRAGVARMHADGSVDTAFGEDGCETFSFSPDNAESASWVSSVALTERDVILIGGHSMVHDTMTEHQSFDTGFKVARLQWQ